MERDMSSNIEESIGFMKHIFQKVKQIDLQESTSKVVNALVSEFGEEVVFSKNQISITESLLDRVFQVLNQYLFDQKLDQIPISICRTKSSRKNQMKVMNIENQDIR